MALDKTGAYRERLLQTQQEALALLTRRRQTEYLSVVGWCAEPHNRSIDSKCMGTPPLRPPAIRPVLACGLLLEEATAETGQQHTSDQAL